MKSPGIRSAGSSLLAVSRLVKNVPCSIEVSSLVTAAILSLAVDAAGERDGQLVAGLEVVGLGEALGDRHGVLAVGVDQLALDRFEPQVLRVAGVRGGQVLLEHLARGGGHPAADDRVVGEVVDVRRRLDGPLHGGREGLVAVVADLEDEVGADGLVELVVGGGHHRRADHRQPGHERQADHQRGGGGTGTARVAQRVALGEPADGAEEAQQDRADRPDDHTGQQRADDHEADQGQQHAEAQQAAAGRRLGRPRRRR